MTQKECPIKDNGFEYLNNHKYCEQLFGGKSALEAIEEEKVDNQNCIKLVDEIEPKFKIEKGKWYVCIRDLLDNYANKAFRKGDTYLSTQDGSLIPSNSNVPFKVACPDTYFRDWTIKDANDGDVLANDHHILILKELVYDWSSNGTPYSVKAYCGIKPNGNFEIGKDNWCFCGTLHIHLATKEQRDLLFQKIKEAGYEWIADKKELRRSK